MKSLAFKTLPGRFRAIKQKVAQLSSRKVEEDAFRLDTGVIRRWRWSNKRSYYYKYRYYLLGLSLGDY